MNSTIASIAALTVCASTLAAQDTTVATSVSTPFFSNFTLTEDVGVYTKKNDASTVTAFNTLIGVDAVGLSWHLSVPGYLSDNDNGYGSIELGTSWNALKGVNFLGSVTTVAVEGGLFLPTGSAGYDATDVVPHVGTSATLVWGALSFGQSIDWQFVTGSMYDPVIDRFSSDLCTLESSLDYKLADSFNIGVDLTQYYLTEGDSGTIIVTPNVSWDVSSSIALSAGVGLPVWQNLATENDYIVNAGVSFKF